MKFIFLSIGKSHDPYVKPGIEDFTKRITHYYKAEWLLLLSPKNISSLPEQEQKRQEATIILQNIQPTDHVILLDERGTQLSSIELSAYISKSANENVKRIVFIIGGAFGVDQSVITRASFQWSLSKLVFPHQLVRLILAEQVYRACTIIKNEKYHHK